MRRRLAILFSLAASFAAACKTEDAATAQRIDALIRRIDTLDERIAALEKQRKAAAAPASTPDPSAVYAVPVEGSPYKGPARAKVTLVMAHEFACPFCARVRPTIEALREEYGDQLRVVLRSFIVHPNIAMLPALAACAAHRQGKYAEMEHELWENGYAHERDFSAENIGAMVTRIGLDRARFERDANGDCKRAVENDQTELAGFGVRGTPSFFINGRFLGGAQPAESFRKLIDEELAKADRAIAGGIPLERYYAEAVLARGRKPAE